jgi:hypothetical protein
MLAASWLGDSFAQRPVDDANRRQQEEEGEAERVVIATSLMLGLRLADVWGRGIPLALRPECEG